jgi:D-mannonate dehydratase
MSLVLQVLGRGQFGVVSIAVEKATGAKWACKSVSKRRVQVRAWAGFEWSCCESFECYECSSFCNSFELFCKVEQLNAWAESLPCYNNWGHLRVCV